jgi:hypothetical protein
MGATDGLVIYNVTTHTWTVYNRANTPGFRAGATDDYVARVAYDEDANVIICGESNAWNYDAYDKIQAFTEGGSFYIGRMIEGAESGGSYTFGASSQLTKYGKLDLTIALDPQDTLWALFTHQAAGDNERSLQWDRDSMQPELQDYIVAGRPVAVAWELGKITRAEFTLARGDLFDPTNTMSIYNPVVAKGRLIELYFGELVGGLEFWQLQGIFVVTGLSISYGKDRHPTITVTAEDRSVMWGEMNITASAPYNGTAFATVFAELMALAGLTVADYDAPAIGSPHTVYMQWVDESLAAILEQLCDHYGLYPHWQQSGKFTLRAIDTAAAVAHAYASTQKIIDWTTDDRFSSFVNRVTVRCEGHDFIEVLWDEERVGSKNGTVGFWTKNEKHKIYFSDDRTRRCRYVRMDVLQSINDYSPLMKLLGGKGDEYLSTVDPSETWVEVKIESPNRALYAFAFAAAVLIIGTIALTCGYYNPCGIYIMATNLALSMLIQGL